ncbi:hypothetical protein EPA93_39580 [Ktedonosporobacter rubrisoli]|uniref:Uncharacterized protein n=1 Tax=Ktedonosporobacter rubrisoli TaxID=2509675 RepID=A0A4V0Z026_KTERU|nr:polysaccharide biosynthesis C-terminal domain-containing protein [Ktedonosporobacter rubrisoli]QBD81751.1 hypothetical protein EPA93_39580 [Ktedonosporobacter rubrisoli]
MHPSHVGDELTGQTQDSSRGYTDDLAETVKSKFGKPGQGFSHPALDARNDAVSAAPTAAPGRPAVCSRTPAFEHRSVRSSLRARKLLKAIQLEPVSKVLADDLVVRINRIIGRTITGKPASQYPAESVERRRELEDTLPRAAVRGLQEARTDKRNVVASTAGGAAVAGAGDLISAILRYTTNVAMTHLVTQSIYGIFVETNTLITVLGYASKLGLDSTTLRFLSTYRAKGNKALAAGLLRFSACLALLSGILGALLFFVFASYLAHSVYHREIYTLPFREAAILIPLIGMQLVLASGLQALKAIKWKVYVDRIVQPGLTLVMLFVFYHLGLRLEALIFATICGFVGSTLLGRFLLRKAARRLIKETTPRYARKIWLRFAFPMFFNSMIRNVLNSTDILFLGAFATTAQIGLYGAADRVSYFVVAPLIALNMIFSPVIAEYHSHKKHQQLASMFKVVTKWSFSLSWPIFLCCCIYNQAILGVFGEKYVAAGLVLIILGFGNLVDSGVGSVNYLLVMTGRPRVILTNTVATVVVNIALALFLVPRFGILGAAAAAALTLTLLNIVGLIEVYWIMRIHPYRRDILKPLIAGGVASLVGMLLARFVHVGYGHLAILGTIGLLGMFMLVYASMLMALRFSEEDMMVLDMVRARLAKKKGA